MGISSKVILAFALVMLWIAPAAAGHLNIVNKLPDKNPCKDLPADQQLPDDVYNDLKAGLSGPGMTAVLGDIDQAIDTTLTDNKIDGTGSIDVEVNIAPDAASYNKMLKDSGGTLSEADINARFGKYVGWTDFTGTKPKQKLRITVFCGEHLRVRLAGGYGVRLIVHELVHAQLFFMTNVGLPETKLPFKGEDEGGFVTDQQDHRRGHDDEHNAEFNARVEHLTDLYDDAKTKAEQPKTAEVKKPSKTAEEPKKKATVKKRTEKRGKAASGQAGAPVSSGVQFSIGGSGGGFSGGGGGGGFGHSDSGGEDRGSKKR